MVLDIQTVHHILKNTAVQNVNKPFVYITDLTSTLSLGPGEIAPFDPTNLTTDGSKVSAYGNLTACIFCKKTY
jgi:hypothetical protein